MKRIGLALLAALLGALPCARPVLGQACEPLPVSALGQLGCSVNLHAGAQQVLALGANLGGDAHTGSVTVCLGGASLKCESPLTPADGQAGDEFGRSVAIDDDWLAVGSPFAKGSGVIYLYRRAGSQVTLAQELSASNAARGDQFGLTLALSGETLIVGAPNAVGKGGSLSGAVYVFHLDGETWSERQILTAGDARPFDNFGFSLAIDGSLAIVGAPFHDGVAGNSGAAYVFRQAGGSWSQQERLTASDDAANAEYGSAVAVSGSALAVGARAAGAGEAYVYEPGGPAGWSEAARFSGEAVGDRFGVAAAMDASGTQLVIGALLHGGTGAAYLYKRQASGWVQDGPPLPGAAPGDRFGQAVSADGGEALVGAYLAHGPSAGEVCPFTPHQASADLGISLRAPASIGPGQILTYELTVTNHGPDPATGVQVQAMVPPGLTAAAALPGGCTMSPKTIDCSLADLDAGKSWTVSLDLAVPETCVPAFRSSATVVSDVADPAASNNTSQGVSTSVVRIANLAITALPGPPFLRPGASVSYQFKVTNAGPDIACGVVVVDTLPAALRVASPGLAPGCEVTSSGLRCSTAALAVGSSYDVSVVLTAPLGCGGAVVDSATVSAVPPAADPDPKDDSVRVEIPIATDVSITEKASRDIAKPNQPLTYTIEVGNPDGCRVTVKDSFPAALKNVHWCREVSPAHCGPSTAGDLVDVVTGPATYRVQGVVDPNFLGMLTNTATVEGPPGVVDADPDNNSTTYPTQISQLDQGIPTLGMPGLAALALLLALTALRRLRRRSL